VAHGPGGIHSPWPAFILGIILITMQTQHQKIIDQVSNNILDKYKNNSNVVGIFLVGSAAQNVFDKYSDIDFFIILNKSNGLSRENFVSEEKINVEILFDTVAETQRCLREERFSLYRNTSHMLAMGQLLYSSSNAVKQIQLKAQNNLNQKTRYSDGEIIMHKYSIDDFLGDVRRDVNSNDAIAFGQDSHYVIQNSVELLLKFNGSYNLKPKMIAGHLRSIDQPFVDMLNSFYESQSASEKLQLLERISEYAITNCGGKLPARWSLEKKS